MITDYHTKSGSIYQVDLDNKRVRAKAKANDNNGKRLGYDWRPFESMDDHGVGHPLYFWWGGGLDEISVELGTPPELGESIRRCTYTSPVVAIGE